MTALHAAAEEGDIELMKALVEAGDDVNKRNKNGDTPFHYAAKGGHLNAMQWLHDRGANPFAIGENRRCPISRAAANGHLAATVWLWNLDDHSDFRRLEDAILESIYNEQPHVLEYLINNSSDVDDEENRASWLHYAGYTGFVSVIDVLCKHGLNINFAGNDGSALTALHSAVEEGHIPAVEYLSSKGADVNYLAQNGATPLHCAVIMGNLPMIQCLCRNGADPSIGDLHEYYGRSHRPSYDERDSNNRFEIRRYLRDEANQDYHWSLRRNVIMAVEDIRCSEIFLLGSGDLALRRLLQDDYYLRELASYLGRSATIPPGSGMTKMSRVCTHCENCRVLLT